MEVAYAGPGSPDGVARLRALRFDEREIAARQEFLEFGGDDAARLRELRVRTEIYADPLIDDLDWHLLSFEET